MEGLNLVFVLAGADTANVAEMALLSMTSYLDLPIGPKTPVVAAQAIQKYLGTISLTPPSDRFSKNGRTWWKVSVPKDAWDKSRLDLLALFETVASDPVLELERAADELYRQGRYLDAVTGYVIAAAAIAEVRPVPVARFRAAVGKAQEILSSFTLTSTTPAQITEVGKPFGSTFDVRLSFGSGPQAPSVVGAPLRFSYKARKNGRPAVTGQTVKTNLEGEVQFELPAPDFASQDSLVVLVDVNPWMEALVAAPQELRDSVAKFETITAERRLQLPFTVDSASKQVPMIVALADFDERGIVQRRQETTGALIAALQKAGFSTSGIPVNPTLLKTANDNVVLAAWKFQGKTSGRAVYGTVNLVSVVASGSQFNAEVSGTLKVADLATSKAVYQLKSTKVASAGDRASAVALAFRQWAEAAATTLESDLP